MVLKRISLIEAHMMNSTLPMASFHSALRKSCEKVLHDFHLDINRFEKSMDYYATHQEEMTVIYTAILDSLTKESSKYSAIPAPSTKDKPVVSNPTLPGAPTEVRANSNEDSEPKPGLFRKRFRLQKRRKK